MAQQPSRHEEECVIACAKKVPSDRNVFPRPTASVRGMSDCNISHFRGGGNCLRPGEKLLKEVGLFLSKGDKEHVTARNHQHGVGLCGAGCITGHKAFGA